MKKHSELPWKAFVSGTKIAGPNNLVIARSGSLVDGSLHQLVCLVTPVSAMTDEDMANAELIVRACNCHDELCDALEGLCAWVDSIKIRKSNEGIAASSAAYRAIKKARGE